MTSDWMKDHDTTVVIILRKREGTLSLLKFVDGTSLRCFNIAWGYDLGDDFAHVTVNASPSIVGEDTVIFETPDLIEITDEHGCVVYERKTEGTVSS